MMSQPTSLMKLAAAVSSGAVLGYLAATLRRRASSSLAGYTLLCDPRSTCSMKCLLTIAECGGLDAVTVKPISLDAKQQKDPDYVRDYHPFGKVPVLVTPTGTRIYETLAIVTCLSSARNGGLVPDDPTSAALMQQWISVHSSYFKPAMFPEVDGKHRA